MTATTLTGSCAFRLMPHDDLADGPAEAVMTRLGDGFTLHYTWVHPTDGEQRGTLLVGGVGEEGLVEAALFDTWHQHPGLLTLTGTRDGSRTDLSATYAGDWGWQVAIDLGEAETAMTMRNVIPASAADSPAEAGAYDVMVATWR